MGAGGAAEHFHRQACSRAVRTREPKGIAPGRLPLRQRRIPAQRSSPTAAGAGNRQHVGLGHNAGRPAPRTPRLRRRRDDRTPVRPREARQPERQSVISNVYRPVSARRPAAPQLRSNRRRKAPPGAVVDESRLGPKFFSSASRHRPRRQKSALARGRGNGTIMVMFGGAGWKAAWAHAVLW